jgi:hypothetical protein
MEGVAFYSSTCENERQKERERGDTCQSQEMISSCKNLNNFVFFFAV